MITTQGPAIDDAVALLAWFNGEGAGRRVKLPIVLTPNPLGLGTAFIGAVPGSAPDGAVWLALDDTAMSVGLNTRLQVDCPWNQPCAIWIEGIWGATLSGWPGLGLEGRPGLRSPKAHPFSVRGYGGPVSDKTGSHVLLVV